MTDKIDRRRREYLDPEWAHDRAVKARAAQSTVGYHVDKVAQRSSELTQEDLEKLRTLVREQK